MNEALLFITPQNGSPILGIVEHQAERDGDMSKVKDAIYCERIKLVTRIQGQFELTYVVMPIDIFDQSPKTIFVKLSSYFIIEEDSKLKKLYDETLKNWQIQRAGLISPTQGDVNKVRLPGGNGS